MSTYQINIVYILVSAKSKKPAFFQISSSYFPDSWQQKNVPWRIRASRAVACDNLHLRASAHHWHVSAFLRNREFQGISCYAKKPGLQHSAVLAFSMPDYLIIFTSGSPAANSPSRLLPSRSQIPYFRSLFPLSRSPARSYPSSAHRT